MKPALQRISVVIPALNEADELPDTVRHARANAEVCELILVDGGSKDGTCDVAAGLGCRVLVSAPGRGRQLRLGAAQARGEVVMLLHADTWIPPSAGRAIFECLQDETVVAGGFWKVFRDAPWLMRGSRARCALRLWLGRRVLGDQAMFVRRETLERIGGVPDMDLMEEYELCRRLRQVGRLALAPATVTTSARRFRERGVIRTYFRMWRVALCYRLGVASPTLKRIYEEE